MLLSSAAFSVSRIVILMTCTWCSLQCPHFLLMHQRLCGVGKIRLYLLKYVLKKAWTCQRTVYVATSLYHSLMISSHIHSITVHIYVVSQTLLGQDGDITYQEKNFLKVWMLHLAITGYLCRTNKNRMNAYLSVVGVHVANKGQSNRAGSTAVFPRKDRNRGKVKQHWCVWNWLASFGGHVLWVSGSLLRVLQAFAKQLHLI